MKHTNAQKLWSKPLEAQLYQIDDPLETEETAAPSETDLRAEHNINIWANKIGYVLASDKISEDLRAVVYGVLVAAANEAGVSTDDIPEFAKASFPVIMKRSNTSYQRAFIHSIDNILFASVSEAVIDKLKQFEKRFEPQQTTESGDKPEYRKTAEYLSGLMNDEPPEPLKEVLQDGLVDMFNSHIDQSECNELQKSPESIEKILNRYAIRQEAEQLKFQIMEPEKPRALKLAAFFLY